MHAASRYRLAAVLIAAAVLVPVALLAVLTWTRTPSTARADVLLYPPVGAQIPEQTLLHDEALFTKAAVARTTATILRNNVLDPVTVAPDSVSLVRDSTSTAFHIIGRAEDPELAARIALTASGVYLSALRGQFALQRPVVQPPAPADDTTPVVLAVLVTAALTTKGMFLLRSRTEAGPGFTTRPA